MSVRLLLATAGLIGLLGSLPAYAAAPLELHHQGRIMDATGIPVDGQQIVTVRLYSKQVNGTLLWAEDIDADFDNGYFAINLGADSSNALEADVFSDQVWVELEVAGSLIPDRQRIVSVPYAIVAGQAAWAEEADSANTAINVSGGSVDASEILVDGQIVIDADGNFLGTDTLMSLGCVDGEGAVVDSGDWACAEYDPIVDFTDLANVPTGLDDGDDDGLGDMYDLCDQGQFPSWNATDKIWGCGSAGTAAGPEIIEAVETWPLPILMPEGSQITVGSEELTISTLQPQDVYDLIEGNDVVLGEGSRIVQGSEEPEISTVTINGNAMGDVADYLEGGSADLSGTSTVDGTDLLSDYLTEPELTTALSSGQYSDEDGIDLDGTISVDGGTTLDQLVTQAQVDDSLASNSTQVKLANGSTYKGDPLVNTTQLGDASLTVDFSDASVGGDSVVTATGLTDAIDAAGNAANTAYVNATGDSMSGTLTVANANVNVTGTGALQVDGTDIDDTYVNETGDTLSGGLGFTGSTFENPSIVLDGGADGADFSVFAEGGLTVMDHTEGNDSARLTVVPEGGSGGVELRLDSDLQVIGGGLTVNGTEVALVTDLDDHETAADNKYVDVSGDTMTGTLTVSGGNVDVNSGNVYIDQGYSLSVGTGAYLEGDTTGVAIRAADNDEYLITAEADGAVELRHDDTIRLTTTGSGVDINGVLDAVTLKENGVDVLDVNDADAAFVNIGGDTMTGTLVATSLKEGTNEVHNVGQSDTAYVNVGGDTMTGNLTMSGADVDIQGGDLWMDNGQIIRHGDAVYSYGTSTQWMARAISTGEVMLSGTVNGPASLYYDGSLKLSTTGSGISVVGTVGASTVSATTVSATTVSGTNVNKGGQAVYNYQESDAAYVNVGGDTMTGTLVATSLKEGTTEVHNVDQSDAAYVNIAGDTMTGDLYIDDAQGSPSLYLKDADNSTVQLYNASGSAYLYNGSSQMVISGANNGAATLYEAGNWKLTTNGSGVTVNGTLDATAVSASTVSVTNLTASSVAATTLTESGVGIYNSSELYTKSESDGRYLNVAGDTMSGNLTISNANPGLFLNDSDGDGTVLFYNFGGSVYLYTGASEYAIVAIKNGATSLYYDGGKKLATDSNGVSVTGTLAATTVTAGTVLGTALDGTTVTAGTLYEGIYGVYNSDEADSRYVNVAGDTMTKDLTIDDSDGSPTLYLKDTDNSTVQLFNDVGTAYLRTGSNENALVAYKDGDTHLYQNGGSRLHTTATGVEIDGELFIDDNDITINDEVARLTLEDESYATQGWFLEVDVDNLYIKSENDENEIMMAFYDDEDKVEIFDAYIHMDGVKQWGNAGGWYLQNQAGGYLIYAYTDTSVNLRYANGTKLATTASGIQVTGSISYASDERLKENIEPIGGALDDVLALEGVTYNWRDSDMGEGVQYGFIAQDVQEVRPEIVESMGYDPERPDSFPEDALSVDYVAVVPMLVEAVKELEGRLTDLEEENRKLKRKLKNH
jgi:hypothetical protein